MAMTIMAMTTMAMTTMAMTTMTITITITTMTCEAAKLLQATATHQQHKCNSAFN